MENNSTTLKQSNRTGTISKKTEQQQQKQQPEQDNIRQQQQNVSTSQQQQQNPPPPAPTKQRNKLKRCAKQSSIDQSDDETALTIANVQLLQQRQKDREYQQQLLSPLQQPPLLHQQQPQQESLQPRSPNVAMGGSFTSPHTTTATTTAQQSTINPVKSKPSTSPIKSTTTSIATTIAKSLKQIHEKSVERDEKKLSKEKTERFKFSRKDKTKQTTTTTAAATTTNVSSNTLATGATTKSKETTTSTSTTSKFAERLRRSFRRGEHRSLELKKNSKLGDLIKFSSPQQPPPPPPATTTTAKVTTTTTTSVLHTQLEQQKQLRLQLQYLSSQQNTTATTTTYTTTTTNAPTTTTSQSNIQNFGIHKVHPLVQSHRFSQQSLHSLGSLNSNSNSNSNLTTTGSGCIGVPLNIVNSGAGGHINPALLLDSPEESTPSEFNYQHLSSVATTNSSTSLESNFGEFSEQPTNIIESLNNIQQNRTTTTSDSSYNTFYTWPQQHSSYQLERHLQKQHQEQRERDDQLYEPEQIHQNSPQQQISPQASMGGGIISRATSVGGGRSGSGGGNASLTSQDAVDYDIDDPPPPPRSPRSGAAAQATLSPSCSVTSESSSAKVTRLQNTIFKSSNESRSSYQGHSNEGFTASSHNSSSGEWENVGACGTTPSFSNTDFRAGSFPEEFEAIITDESGIDNVPVTSTISIEIPTTDVTDSSCGGSYYQYTLSSPNNPFLPEIIARTYHSTCDDEPDELLDSNITSVKYISGGGSGGGYSPKLLTRDHSRAGSQESTHSDSGFINPPPVLSSPVPSSSSSTPGRQRRKLFSLHSPTRHLLHQQSSHHQPSTSQQTQSQAQTQPTTSSSGSATSSTEIVCKSNTSTTSNSVTSVIASGYSGAGSLVRYLNPFLPSTSAAAGNASTKRAPLKQTPNVTSPTAVPQDLNAKREEFLRATMKICLVVSPPSKLQMKSKSLTHLDGLDSMVAYPHGASTTGTTTLQGKSNTSDAGTSQLQHQSHDLTPSPSSLLVNANTESGASNIVITTTTGFMVTTVVVTTTITGPTLTTSNFSGLSYKKKTSFMHRKKPLLPRSEVSSSEYFSISFCTESGPSDEEFIPAKKGVALGNAVLPALRRKNLILNQVCFVDSTTASTLLEPDSTLQAVALDENTDAESLAAHHLLVLERDSNKKVLQKAASLGARLRPTRLLSSASTEEPTETVISRNVKQRWSTLFGFKNPQLTQLCELLNGYDRNGVPQRVVEPSPELTAQKKAALKYLAAMHKSWREFIKSDHMSDREAKIQTAIWELVTTEILYIHTLQTVTDLFLACLEAIQGQNLLTDVDQNRLFANIRDICKANLLFWTQHLYPMVAYSVTTTEPLRIEFFEEGFITFGTIFSPYTKYCAEQSSCQFYCKELNRNNTLFTSYLAWCESQKMCNRLRLADILVRPMQRLTKYSLLLTAIKRHMPVSEETEVIDAMVHCVETFVGSVNNHLTQRQETERLKGVMARIESYDVVPNTNNEYLEKIVRQYSMFFDLCSAMKYVRPFQARHLFMEGDHKFKDHLGKVDVHCFLFTDILLVCKNVTKKGVGAVKVIRQPYFTDRLLVHQTNNVLNCVYLNEFNLAITAFTLQCMEAKNWFEALRRARMIYIKLKQASANLEGFHTSSTSSASIKPAPPAPTAAAATAATAASTAAAASVSSTTAATASTSTVSTTSNAVQTDEMDITASLSSVAHYPSSATNLDSSSARKSAASSAHCSHVSSGNNSHSGSVEWNDSRNVSIDFDKTNSFSSDDGSAISGSQIKSKSPNKLKVIPSSANTLSVQPTNNLVQSLPNLNLQTSQNNNLYHTYSNNTLLVPGTRHSRNLLSPNFHNISYPPPSPTRTSLRRVCAVPQNPPLVKTRNITSQSSINWHQIPATPTPPSPQSQKTSPHDGAVVTTTTTTTATTTTTTTTTATTVNEGEGGGGGGVVSTGFGLEPLMTTTIYGTGSQCSPISVASQIHSYIEESQTELGIEAKELETGPVQMLTWPATTDATIGSSHGTIQQQQQQQQYKLQRSNETDV